MEAYEASRQIFPKRRKDLIQLLKILLTGLITSFFIFPFNLPVGFEVNTKMILAAFGLIVFFIERIQDKEFRISTDFLMLSLLAIALSLWARLSMSYNHTNDGTYASYFISLWVWLGGAYFVVWVYRMIHGEVTPELIGNYLIGVCAAQCILAYSMTLFPPLHSFIDSLMSDSDAFMGRAEGRMYGLGAALDPSGLRFSGTLIICSFIAFKASQRNNMTHLTLYIIAFLVITIFGNMISRSTTVGVGLAIVLFGILFNTQRKKGVNIPYFIIIATVLAGICILLVHLYNSNVHFRNNLRFGFEGFFSLAEQGKWDVHSNEILKNMVVWPETLKTWLIGDGYCDNPLADPNFLGVITGGYYMGTDIGYLRFIFYFGLPGAIMMAGIFIYSTVICIRRLNWEFTLLFGFLLISNLIGWIKVTSDILMIYSPFLILAFQKAEECMKAELTSSNDNA